jgi:hypothetical protein
VVDTGTEGLPVDGGVVRFARPVDDLGERICAIGLALPDWSGRAVDRGGIGLVLRPPAD